jgi:peptide/nickel transport system substrate-binding protein
MIAKAMEQNPYVSSYSGRDLPYGNLDYWPFGLSFNCSEPPFDNKDVRWAISYAINRQEMVDVAYQGGGMISAWNLPPYAKLETYKAAIADLFEKYPTTEFNLEKSAERMRMAGYTMGDDGFWQDAEGNTLSFTVITFSWALADTIPMVQQLREAGFDADYSQNPEGYTMMMQGTADAYLFGHGASIEDPYATMRMYQSRYSAPTGEMATFAYRWTNEEYDAIVDEMATVHPDDPRTIELLHDGMEIWLEDLPDIPLVQNYHRNPHNETYWVNWPSVEDSDVNDAWWHTTALLWVYQMEKAQE